MWSRSRPTSRTAWWRSCWSGCRTRRLREARDRIRSAIVNSRQSWPQRRITVGLSPASLPKRGSGFDAAIAVAILSAAGSVPKERLVGTVFLGELGLDGRLRPVPGVLPCTAAAAAAGFERAVVPPENAAEAALVPAMQVVAAPSLSSLIDWLQGRPASAAGPAVEVVDSGAGLTPVVLREPGAGRTGAISPRWWGSRSPGGPRRSPPLAVITCCCSGRQESARRCWLSGCRRSCRRWSRPRRWRSARFTRWRERCGRTGRW